MANIVIIDPSPFIRAGVAVVLTSHGHSVIGSYGTGASLFLDQSIEAPVDVVITEIKYNGIDSAPKLYGFDFLQTVRERLPNAKRIILTSDRDFDTIETAIHLRVDGYLIKEAPDSDKEIILSVDRALAGGRYISSSIIDELVSIIGERRAEEINAQYVSPRMVDVMEKLTERQIDVMRLLGKGYKNEDIAEELFIAPTTVSAHKQNIVRVLELQDTSDLARLAVQLFK